MSFASKLAVIRSGIPDRFAQTIPGHLPAVQNYLQLMTRALGLPALAHTYRGMMPTGIHGELQQLLQNPQHPADLGMAADQLQDAGFGHNVGFRSPTHGRAFLGFDAPREGSSVLSGVRFPSHDLLYLLHGLHMQGQAALEGNHPILHHFNPANAPPAQLIERQLRQGNEFWRNFRVLNPQGHNLPPGQMPSHPLWQQGADLSGDIQLHPSLHNLMRGYDFSHNLLASMPENHRDAIEAEAARDSMMHHLQHLTQYMQGINPTPLHEQFRQYQHAGLV